MKTDVALQKKLWKTFDWGMQKGMLASINQDYYYKGSREAMLEKIHIQEINTDWNPITEYYFGYNLKRYYGKL